MNKYGKPLRFGYSPIPTATEPMRPVQLAGMAETYGLDYVGIQAPSYSAEHHELWTLLTAMGMSTKAITLFVLMPEMVVHSPALWAKAAASLDLLTNGRVEIGVGIGGGANPLAGRRSEKWSKAEALEAVEEAIQVIRLMWRSEPVGHFAGKFCRLGEMQPGPTPT